MFVLCTNMSSSAKNWLYRNARTLLCTFHVVKAVKTHIARQNLSSEKKRELLSDFRRCLYAFSEQAFDDRWIVLQKSASQLNNELHEYLEQNWKLYGHRWAICQRLGLPTLGNNTNNRMERFNRTFKEVLKKEVTRSHPYQIALRHLWI